MRLTLSPVRISSSTSSEFACIEGDVVSPTSWPGSVLDEIDLELDVLRYADRRIHPLD